MQKDKCRELFLKQQGTLKEQEQQLVLQHIVENAGEHPFFKVSNSRRIKNKVKRSRK